MRYFLEEELDVLLENKRNIIFELTNTCNMKCKYCFEADLNSKPSFFLDINIIKKTIDRVITTQKQEYMITFFGGEPLICYHTIFAAMDYAQKKARERKCYVNYNILTNGTLINDEIIEQFNKRCVYTFFSFDGAKEIQDKYRIGKDGVLSYSIVSKNIRKFIESRKNMLSDDNMAIRMTVTNELIPQLTETYLKLRDDMHCKKITFALVSADDSKEYAIGQNDLGALREQYLELADIYVQEIKQGESHNRFFESIVKNIFKGIKKQYFCDCGGRYIAIGADGDLYPCEGFLECKEFKLGNIITETVCNDSGSIQSVEENNFCKNCWAKYLCGGSCYHECYMKYSNVNQKNSIMCQTYKLAVEIGLRIYVDLKNQGLLEVFNKLTKEQLPENVYPIIDKDIIQIFEKSNLAFISQGDSYNILELDEMSFEILLLCDGNNSILNIVEIIANEYECDKKTIYEDINNIIVELRQKSAIYLTN